MFWSFRNAPAALAMGAMLAAVPSPVVADVTARIAAGGRIAAASNPFLLPGGESALLAEGSVSPSLTIDSADGSELALDGVLIGRGYSRRYGGYALGSATATGILRDSERLSLTGLASYERDVAADTLTEDVGGASGPRSIRNALRGRAAAAWRPSPMDTLTPQIDYERVSYGDDPRLQTVTALSADLGYSRRLDARTSLGARALARRSRAAGDGRVTTIAAFATGERQLSQVLRLSFDIGAERVRQGGDLPPGARRTRTNLSGRTRLCAEGQRLTGCADLSLASEVSPLGGVQRRYAAAASAQLRLSERYQLEAVAEYSKAERSSQSAAPGLGAALARLRLAWTASERTVVSGDIEYRRRDFGGGGTADGVLVGVGLRWGTR